MKKQKLIQRLPFMVGFIYLIGFTSCTNNSNPPATELNGYYLEPVSFLVSVIAIPSDTFTQVYDTYVSTDGNIAVVGTASNPNLVGERIALFSPAGSLIESFANKGVQDFSGVNHGLGFVDSSPRFSVMNLPGNGVSPFYNLFEVGSLEAKAIASSPTFQMDAGTVSDVLQAADGSLWASSIFYTENAELKFMVQNSSRTAAPDWVWTSSPSSISWTSRPRMSLGNGSVFVATTTTKPDASKTDAFINEASVTQVLDDGSVAKSVSVYQSSLGFLNLDSFRVVGSSVFWTGKDGNGFGAHKLSANNLAPDASYGTAGSAKLNVLGTSVAGKTIQFYTQISGVDSAGRILACGSVVNGGNIYSGVWRLDAQGALDASAGKDSLPYQAFATGPVTCLKIRSTSSGVVLLTATDAVDKPSSFQVIPISIP